MGLRRLFSWTVLSRALVAGGLAAAVLAAVPGGAQVANRVGLNGAPCAYETVGGAIADAIEGDIVFVSPGTYNETIGFIDFDLSIVGAGAACSGPAPAGSSSVFIDGGGSGATNGGHAEVLNAELILIDLTLRDARAEVAGGLVFVDGGILDLTRVAMIDGFADGDGGAIAGVNNSTVIVDDSFFLGNEAGSDGGAISIDGGTLSVQDSDMFGELTPAGRDSPVHADNGGLLAVNGGASATVARTRLTRARASESGGAVYVDGPATELDMNFGQIDANYAFRGGALFQGEGAVVRIDDSAVGDNDASYAASLHLEAPVGSGDQTTLTVLRTEISGGTINGGVRASGPVEITLVDTVIQGYRGANFGAVHGEDGALVFITDSVIKDNVATSAGGSPVAGGISGDSALIQLVRTEVTDNLASVAGDGGVSVRGGVFIAIQSLIAGNRGYGAGGIGADGAVVRLVDSVVANNDGASVGGIYVWGGPGRLDIEASTIVSNHSDGLFGVAPGVLRSAAIQAGGSTNVDIENSIVWGNESDAGAVGVEQTLAQWSFSDVQQSGGSASWDASLGLDLGGNVDVDPLLDESLVPAPGSPVRDTGNSSLLSIDVYDVDGDGLVFEPLPLDFAGRVRVRGPQLDIGALERPDRQFVLDNRPCSIYDYGNATGTLSSPMEGGETFTLQVTGTTPASQGVTNSCIEPGADAGLFHLFGFYPQEAGNLRLSAANVVPNGGVLNYGLAPGFQNRLFNSSVVPSEVSSGGFVDLTANGGPSGEGNPAVSVSLRSVGYFIDDVPTSETGLDFFPLAPCAVLDSRDNQGATGGFVGPFSADTQFEVDVTGSHPAGQGGGSTNCGVPDDAEGVIVNLVAINGTGFGYVGALSETAVAPSGVVHWAGHPANNAVSTVIPIAADGTISVSVNVSSGGAHVRAVVLGYVDDTGGLQFNPLSPCAAFDSRGTVGASGTFLGVRTSGSPTTYQVAGGALPVAQGGNNGGDCGVPEDARFVMVNLVAIGAVAPGNLRADATGSTPTGGVLNFAADPPLSNSNAVTIPLDEFGRMDVFANGGPVPDGTPLTEVRGVVLGYFD